MARAIGKYAGPWPLPRPVRRRLRAEKTQQRRQHRHQDRPQPIPACLQDRLASRQAGMAQVDDVGDQHDADVDDHAISTMNPIMAIIVMVVPVSVRNQIEPTIANRIEVMIDSG